MIELRGKQNNYIWENIMFLLFMSKEGHHFGNVFGDFSKYRSLMQLLLLIYVRVLEKQLIKSILKISVLSRLLWIKREPDQPDVTSKSF